MNTFIENLINAFFIALAISIIAFCIFMTYVGIHYLFHIIGVI
jgi:hypothetical protein